jgi:phosphonate transport system substrate-binding protein
MTLTRRAFAAIVASFMGLGVFSAVGCDSGSKTEGSGGTTGTAPLESPSPDTGMPTKLVFGFIPSAEADKIADNAKPMADFIAKEIGIPVDTFTSTDYAGMIEAMGSRKVDIGSLGPLAYVLAKDQGAADVLLKTSRNKVYTYPWLFIVRADSGINKLEDLKGKTIAFVDASSASGYLYPAYFLRKEGFNADNFFKETVFAGSHDTAARSVYSGDVDVAAIYGDARDKLIKSGLKDAKDKTKVLYTSAGTWGEIPNDAIAVRPGLPEELKEKIRAALVKYSNTPEGAATLKEVYDLDALSPAKDSDYDPVREVAKEMGVNLQTIAKKPKATPTPAAKAP